MIKKVLPILSLVLLISSNIFAQYPEVTLYDIQYQDSLSLVTNGDQPSPLLGDTLVVTGLVMNPAYTGTVTTLNSGAPAVYIQDTSGSNAFGGILVRFPNGSSPQFDAIDSGIVAKFTGIVTEFFVTTQFDLIEFDGSTIIDQKPRPEPVVITLEDLSLLGSREGNILAEKWEGMLVEIRDVTVTEPGAIGNGSFVVFNNNNTQVVVGNQSRYYLNGTPPLAGTVLEHVRGYIQNRTNAGGQQNLMIIMPVYPEDVLVAQFPPAISSISRNPVLVNGGQSVTVNATIVDPDGSVANAQLYYKVNSGATQILSMTNTGGDNWQAVIPGQTDSSLVDYYLRAVDNVGNVTTNPADTTRNKYFYLVLNRDLTIQDVQYSPFGSGFSAYNNYEVTVRGIVTADTSDINPIVYIQNGTGPWSGLRISGTEVLQRRRGDDITVTGTIGENFSVTMMTGIDSPSDIVINSTSNSLPAPEALATSVIDQISNGQIQAEQWESVLIKYSDITVTDENADGNEGPNGGGNSNFGEMFVADASTSNTRVELQDGNHQYHNFWDAALETQPIRVRTGNMFDELIGVLYYSFNQYKLIPRKDDDFIGFTVDVNEESPINSYELSQNYPNPFNPSTQIKYSVANGSFVSLKIYNILGQEVATLVNNFQNAGSYTINFDASKLASGIYLYKIQAGEFAQVKKMMLVK
ncbi:MAG: T9SS type A sorting domain-containing protein [Ignavibacteriales bacterium]|nr:MAG: T9SS type A sorting domain-containing protein [Ignavibacteriales bacterium]